VVCSGFVARVFRFATVVTAWTAEFGAVGLSLKVVSFETRQTFRQGDAVAPT
jgi:hypothetical protein